MLQQLFFNFPIVASFLGGLLAFLSPCILPLIPSYMSYISGYSIYEKSYSYKTALFNALFFVLGFSVVFFILGLAVVNIIDNILDYPAVRYISGLIVILFGIHFLGLFRIAKIDKIVKLDLSKYEDKRIFGISSFIFGIGFSAGWTPCTGPIISSIAFLAASNQEKAVISMLAFVIGLGLPFIILSIFLHGGLKLLRKFKKHVRSIEIFSGVFLIFIGILIIFNQINTLIGYFEL